MRALLAGLLLSFAPPALADDPFWAHWSDGQAELNGYDLWQPRYGQIRHGRAVLVYVTEPYSRSRRVKADRHDPNDPDQVTVLKLNHVRKFQTGVYDYSAMTSVFADPTRGLRPLTITFSMQEWCGHVFERLAVDGPQVHRETHSYFEGESGQETLASDAVPEDAMFILVRSLQSQALAAPPLSAVLPSALTRRLKHLPLRPQPAAVTQASEARAVAVPAGIFQVRAVTWPRGDGASCTAEVEVPYPHRIVAWRCTDGERAELRGSTRQPYWQQHAEGDEAGLKALGLAPLRAAP